MMQMFSVINESDHRSTTFLQSNKTGDMTRVNLEGTAHSNFVLPFALRLLLLSLQLLNHSIFISEPVNGKPVSIVCSVLRPLPSSSTPHYRNVSSHQCLYLSFPG